MNKTIAKAFNRKFVRRTDEFPGYLGASDGVTVDIAGRPGYCYVRTMDGVTQQAWRENTPPIWGQPVIVGKKGARLTILRMWDVYADPPSAPPIRDHRLTHKFPMVGDSSSTGYDWLQVEMRQLMLLAVHTSQSAFKIDIYPGYVLIDGDWLYYEGETDVDLSSHIPTDGARWVLVSLYNNAGAPDIAYTDGTTDDIDAIAEDDIPTLPSGHIPLAAVMLYIGQFAIQENQYVSDIRDLRQFGSGTAGYLANVDYIDFNTSWSGIANVEGRLSWNSTDGTLQIGLPGGKVVNQIGQELLIPRRVKNTSGVDIKNGEAVYITGGSGNNAYIAHADYGSESTSHGTIAIATEDIDNDAFGFCTTFGLVRGDATQPINTNSYAVGDTLYLATAGTWTNVKPTAPNHLVILGQVYRSHATEGAILVYIRAGWELAELHDVLIPTPTDGQTLAYNSGQGLWLGVDNVFYDDEPIADNNQAVYF